MTQNNLAGVLMRLGERQNDAATLEDAVGAYSQALKERTLERVPLQWAASFGSQGIAMMLIADCTENCTVAEAAAAQIKVAYDTLSEGGHEPLAAYYQTQLPKALAIRDRLKGR